MKLETLMTSMYKQYSSLQSEYANRSFCSTLSIPAPVINDDGECLTPIPERIKKFSSQLASPPAKALETGYSTRIDLECNNYHIMESPNNSKTNFIHKRYKVSPMTMSMKKHIVIKSRSSRERLLRLFSNASTEEACNSKIDDDIKSPINHKNDNEKKKILYSSEYYTVSSRYNFPSSYLVPDQNQFKTNCDNSVYSGKGDYVDDPNNLSLKVPNILTSSRTWKYHTSNHVYAVKVLSDMMSPTLHEYCVWVTNANASEFNLSPIYIPRLIIEWPKNWSYSQI